MSVSNKVRYGCIENYIKANSIVNPVTECWDWIKKKDYDGYGYATWDGTDSRAHRLSYIGFHGPIPDDKPCVCHTCDNPACANPDHLWVGTNEENSYDRHAKGRTRRKLTDDEVLEIYTAEAVAWVLALKYNVSKHTIRSIKSGLFWPELTGATFSPKKRTPKGPL